MVEVVDPFYVVSQFSYTNRPQGRFLFDVWGNSYTVAKGVLQKLINNEFIWNTQQVHGYCSLFPKSRLWSLIYQNWKHSWETASPSPNRKWSNATGHFHQQTTNTCNGFACCLFAWWEKTRKEDFITADLYCQLSAISLQLSAVSSSKHPYLFSQFL